MDNSERKAYPNIMYREFELLPQSKRRGRKFNKVMARKVAIDRAKEQRYTESTFECIGCSERFTLDYSVFVRDTAKYPYPELHVCRDCGNPRSTRFQRIK